MNSVSPATVLVGAPDTTLTLSGVGFTNTTAISLNGVAESTSYISASQVTATVPASQLTAAASLALIASNAGAGSAPVGFTINNPPPVISSLSTTTVIAGTAPGTVTLTGTGFVSTSTISVNGAPRSTSYVDADHLSFSLSPADAAATGTLTITVTNPAPGGGTSVAAQIQVIPAMPSVTSLSPSSVLAGSPDTVVTLTGTNFTSTTVVALNGTNLLTTYVSATQLKVTIPAAQLRSAAVLLLTASNGSGSGSSVAANLTVNNPVPVITSLSAQSIMAGGVAPTVTITGTGFLNSSSVLINGSSRGVNYVSSTQLSFTPSDADVALPGTLAISVLNITPGGGTSPALNITVTAGSPAISGISPNSILAGSVDTTVTITGTNFLTTSTVSSGAVALATTYISNTQLTAVVPASSVASLGWLPLVVQTPSATSTSPVVALAIVVKLQLNINHIVYDQYTRKLWASIGAATSTLAGKSLVPIDPATGAIGTPVPLSDTPDALAISDSGNSLYALTSTSVVRFDLNSNNQAGNAPVGANLLDELSIAPGTENELVWETSFGGTTSIEVGDYNTTTNTLTPRSAISSIPSHYEPCPVFLDANSLIDPYADSGEIQLFPITSTGLQSSSATYIDRTSNIGCMKVVGNVGYTTDGGVYAFTPTSINKIAMIDPEFDGVETIESKPVAPDLSLHQVFFGTVEGGDGPLSLTSASTDTNLITSVITLPSSSPAPSVAFDEPDDLFRWGQDGLALLSHDQTGEVFLYLLSGPFVAPQELNTNTAASITGVSSSTLAVGSGNTILTVTGTNFIPGVAITWNGSYRTTTIVDATHVTIALPASDLAAAGTGTLVATNPGAPASSPLSITVR